MSSVTQKPLPLHQAIKRQYTLKIRYDGGSRKGQVRPVIILALYPHKSDNSTLAMLVYDVNKKELRTYLAPRVTVIEAQFDGGNAKAACEALIEDIRSGGGRSKVNSFWNLFSKKPIPLDLERYGLPNASVPKGYARERM